MRFTVTRTMMSSFRIITLLLWLQLCCIVQPEPSSVSATNTITASVSVESSNIRISDTNIATSNDVMSLVTAKHVCKNKTIIPVKQIGIDVHGLPVCLPLLGSGTWQYNDTIAYESLCKAFKVGIHFVDTAYGYNNQYGVGKAISQCYQGLRSDLFVLTKVPGGLSFQQTLAIHHQNMFALNVEYVDHLMIHYPSDWNMMNASKHIRQRQWLALEEIYYSGKARSIGISHYCTRHIQDIIEIATVMPSINQIEYHIGSGDINNVLDTCRMYNITFMSYSPLCGPCTYTNITEESLINGTLVTSLANKYNAIYNNNNKDNNANENSMNITGSQISLRFIVQQALSSNDKDTLSYPSSIFGGVIPKSNNEDHIKSNLNIFNFEISTEDMILLQQVTKPPGELGDCDVP